MLWPTDKGFSQTAGTPPGDGYNESVLQAREKHGKELLDEIRTTDKRIELRIEKIVDSLKRVGDSKDSRTKLTRLKEDTITAMINNIEDYQRRSAAIREQIARPTANLTEPQKAQIRKVLDSRIEKRIAQIVELEKSMPTHQDHEKYNRVAGDNDRDNSYSRNSDYEQNRKLTLHSDQLRRKLMEDLKRSVSRLEDQNRRLKEQMRLHPDAAEMIQGEIQRNESFISSRNEQMQSILLGESSPTRGVSSGEARDIEAALKIAITELRKDFDRLFAQYTAVLAFLPQINEASVRLEQAKAR